MISILMEDGSIRTFDNPDLRVSFDRECCWIFKEIPRTGQAAIDEGKKDRLVFKIIRGGWKEATYHQETGIEGLKDQNIGNE